MFASEGKSFAHTRHHSCARVRVSSRTHVWGFCVSRNETVSRVQGLYSYGYQYDTGTVGGDVVIRDFELD
ncbi:hypothetical protein B9Z19DRAFT_1071241 [Tuber borchii]|uniref:Uncharacterized protein n=1 Tax=Tuber borchii TaxID=42251 RepID=A0A2T7A8B4_TUBBO|nr:hypothetical protein B9Z19DRAFT_1071241 [Tuber borchii]